MAVSFVYLTTSGAEEARRIARSVVGEGLAACANLFDGVNSIYEWQGSVQDGPECIVVLKTARDRFEALRTRIMELHSYDCPCIVELNVERGHAPFLEWVESQTRH